MSSGAPGGRRDWTPAIGIGLSVLTTWGLMAAGWGALSERTETLRGQHIDQQHEIYECEKRIHTVETSRALETQITALTAEVAALKAEHRALREELARKRR